AGALLMLPFINIILPYLSFAGRSPAREVANFHTLFNVLVAIAALPLVSTMAHLTAYIFPADPASADPGRPRHLNPRALERPAEALACAAREGLRMADIVEMMLRGVIEVFPGNDQKLLKQLSKL